MIKLCKQCGLILFIVQAIFVSGCSFFSPVKVKPDNAYVLSAVPAHVPSKKKHGRILMVMLPDSLPRYNTNQMAYTLRPYQMNYFARNRWVETPAQMLEPLLVQTLRRTHAFKAVVSAPFAGRYHYLLAVKILKLEQDYTFKQPMLRLNLEIQLLQAGTLNLIFSKQISFWEPIRAKNPYEGVFAANRAVKDALRQVAYLVLAHT